MVVGMEWVGGEVSCEDSDMCDGLGFGRYGGGIMGLKAGARGYLRGRSYRMLAGTAIALIIASNETRTPPINLFCMC